MSPPRPLTDVLDEGGPRAPPTPLKLLVVSGPDFGAELRLGLGSHRIGKDAGCDLALSDPAVSRVHLLAHLVEGGVELLDNGSTNGSSLDGVRFTRAQARLGSELQLGRTVLRVVPVERPRPAFPPSERTRFGRLVGKSLCMRELFAVLERLAERPADVLLTGETGTGKELCAEALHQSSPRAQGPFVVCDLAGVAPTLIESELFGHVRGAFTGAGSDRAGAFERANGGTLFLDEVGELSLELQPRLLRALEQREVKRVGADALFGVDVRVVAATHRDLEAEVGAGRFRADLFHRLAVTQVSLPPLRERREDLALLVGELASSLGRPSGGVLGPESLALLEAHDWPGNVRELRNVVSRAITLGQPPEMEGAAKPSAERGPSGADSRVPFKEAKEQRVTAFERAYLADLLQRCEGNLSKASREAGLDRVYLRKLVRKHGLSVGGDDGEG